MQEVEDTQEVERAGIEVFVTEKASKHVVLTVS